MSIACLRDPSFLPVLYLLFFSSYNRKRENGSPGTYYYIL